MRLDSTLAGAHVALATVLGAGAIANPGAHGFSEILYAFSSGANNNGSAFAGLGTTTVGNPSFVLYNWTGAFAMIIGLFLLITLFLHR